MNGKPLEQIELKPLQFKLQEPIMNEDQSKIYNFFTLSFILYLRTLSLLPYFCSCTKYERLYSKS